MDWYSGDDYRKKRQPSKRPQYEFGVSRLQPISRLTGELLFEHRWVSVVRNGKTVYRLERV